MTQKTNTNEQSSTNETSVNMQVAMSSQTTQDLKSAVLIVSVVANLFILTAWLALQVTARYDAQLATFLFTR